MRLRDEYGSADLLTKISLYKKKVIQKDTHQEEYYDVIISEHAQCVSFISPLFTIPLLHLLLFPFNLLHALLLPGQSSAPVTAPPHDSNLLL